MKHVVTILESYFITHDVKCIKVERPKGYKFIPGHATMVALDKRGWKTKYRPFTFTNLNERKYLEFTIKIYRDHNGVTNELGKAKVGDTLTIQEPFGAIHYKGPGVFIAAGSGITPFLSIFRDLHKKKKIKGNRLLYSNKTVGDIIMGKELVKLLGNNFINIITRENVIGFIGIRIDRKILIETIVDFNQHFYICGPDLFVKNICKQLLDLGVTADSLVIEN